MTSNAASCDPAHFQEQAPDGGCDKMCEQFCKMEVPMHKCVFHFEANCLICDV